MGGALAISRVGGDPGELSIPGVTGQGIPFLPAAIDPFEPGGFDIFAPAGRRLRPHRHRRKKALTNDDMSAIAFIAGTVSKAAAGAFAVQLVARSR